MKLVGKVCCWRKCSHIDYRCWFVLKDLLRTLFARHLLYSSEEGYKEPKVVNELKPELEVVDEPDPESPILVELDVFEEPRLEVITELEPVPEPEVEELLIGTLVDFSVESTMELLLSSPAMRILLSLRSPDLYDPLHIFLRDTKS